MLDGIFSLPIVFEFLHIVSNVHTKSFQSTNLGIFKITDEHEISSWSSVNSFFACSHSTESTDQHKIGQLSLEVYWLISPFMQEWISMNCWTSHKAIVENTMMMLLSW